MGKFTSNQKIKIYKCALIEVKAQLDIEREENRYGLCVPISRSARGLFGVSYTTTRNEDFKTNYPEVFKYKPSHCFDKRYWFSRTNRGINKRIHILETVIKELQDGKETKD